MKALGTKDDVLMVTSGPRPLFLRDPEILVHHHRAELVMPSTSSIVSMGKPIMKYSLTPIQPAPEGHSDRVEQVFLRDALVDDVPESLRAGLGSKP